MTSFILLLISQHTAEFGGHRHCDCGDIMVLVCHVTLHNHVTKESNNFMGIGFEGNSPSCLFWWP